MTLTLNFEELVARLRGRSAGSTGKQLEFPTKVRGFVPPTVTVKGFEGEGDPLQSDILLFTAPAAVGKSTFARSLGARANLPLLDLSRIRVSTQSLRGLLSAEFGASAETELREGKFCLIVDALDEGRIFSGEKNFEDFLRTTFELFAEPVGDARHGPKILLFGRPEAVETTQLILEIESLPVSVATLVVNYFDAPAATELVLESARTVRNTEYVDKYIIPIKEVIEAFFDAISKAIQVSPENLWNDSRGRSFAGYAPVLSALGAIIGKEENMNFQKLLQRLRATGPADAWDVLEGVAGAVLEREAEKVRGPLEAVLGSDLAPGAYDPEDQLDHLASQFAGIPFRIAPRLVFGSAKASVSYRDAVRTHLNDHPFLRGGAPANDVLGALVIAHAISGGLALTGGASPKLLAVYGRQPFLWRFVRGRLGSRSLVAGDIIPFVLGSLWSDELVENADISISFEEAGRDPARLRIVDRGRTTEADVLTPLVLRGVVRTLKVNLDGGELILGAWPQSEVPALVLLGSAELRAETIRFDVKHLQVGALGHPSACSMRAEVAVNDQQLAVDLQPESVLSVAGAFENRYPWDSVATIAPQVPDDDPHFDLLRGCEGRFKDGVSVVLFDDYGLTEDGLTDWAMAFGDALPNLMRELVALGLAGSDNVEAKP